MLKTCDHHDCCPIEQVRGEMRPGDYHDVIAANRFGRSGAIIGPELYGIPIYPDAKGNFDCGENDPAYCVEMNDDMKDNFRICCKTCGRATPWGANDIPGMPGAGADWTRKKWNEA